MLMRALSAAVLAVVLVALLAAVALAAEVRITADGFDPQEVTVAPQEQVMWVNDTDSAVTLVADDGSWDSGPIGAGESFSLDLRREGSYEYATEDGAFSGTIEVVEAQVQATETEEPADDAALPTTGLPIVGALLAAGLLLIGGGLLVLRTRG